MPSETITIYKGNKVETQFSIKALQDLYDHLEYFRKLVYELSKTTIPNPLVYTIDGVIDNIESKVERDKQKSIREHMPPTVIPGKLEERPITPEDSDPKLAFITILKLKREPIS